MRLAFTVMAGLLAATTSTQAFAATVVDGTVSSVALFNPKVTMSGATNTYSAMNGNTFQVSGTGGFSNLASTLGRLNGTLNFSSTVGTTVAQSLASFFVFSDLMGGNYNYSVTSVRTNSYVNVGSDKSGTLSLLGTIIDANRNQLTPTPASLSIQFNSTGGSAFSSALSLAVPPATAVPEAASWAMMIMGVGVAGAALRRRSKVTTAVSFS